MSFRNILKTLQERTSALLSGPWHHRTMTQLIQGDAAAAATQHFLSAVLDLRASSLYWKTKLTKLFFSPQRPIKGIHFVKHPQNPCLSRPILTRHQRNDDAPSCCWETDLVSRSVLAFPLLCNVEAEVLQQDDGSSSRVSAGSFHVSTHAVLQEGDVPAGKVSFTII